MAKNNVYVVGLCEPNDEGDDEIVEVEIEAANEWIAMREAENSSRSQRGHSVSVRKKQK